MEKKILILEGNSALQKTLFFDDFTCGDVNRAAKIHFSAGGKGANFCRALLVRGENGGVLLHFSGGENGRKADTFLREEGIQLVSVPVKMETRMCTTCLDTCNNSMTELIEPSFPPDEEEKNAFQRKLDALAEDPAIAAAAITGSLPDGTSSTLYYDWAKAVLSRNKWLFIDAVKGVEKLLSLPGKKILKINRGELARLSGEKDLLAGMKNLLAGGSLYALGITDGPGKAYLGAEGKLWSFSLPELHEVVSPLGCGDTVSAFFLCGLLEGGRVENAFAAALGGGCANCLTSSPASFSMAEACRLGNLVKVTLLGENYES